ncbi:deoxynucleoside kinase [Corallococcus exiguus]|uniref:deoxynucleoside kinase n=1 Tax=Corallococcus TaxID=83461 RepID=UPI000EA09095|nr:MULTISPECIES: deoxynucleoside kinase [Corallococcus]NNC21110.1 deoxynucleoside kinase [Corallococcus exiguus]NRD67847.1 deoxynucleoside kinase [Corallococcus exiguus]RKH16412.1 deoxynucleoside kinase [Corallococcus sp. CA041A]
MPRSTARARPATSRTEPSTKAPPPADADTKPAARNTLKAKVKLPRAKRFVALAGNIGAGKTTAAKLISQGFGFELFDEPVIDNRFLRDYYGDMSRWSFTLQLEFLIRRVEHHELIHSVRKSCVQDRTLYEDPEIFAKYLHGLGHMTNAELDLYYEYFQRLSRHIVRPDKVICFDVPSEEVLLQRIRTRGRAEEKGIGRPFLKGLNGYYAGFPQVLQEKYGVECLVVDVSKQDIRRGAGREEFMDRVSAFLA